MIWRFYVYEHLRQDGSVFYVGKGCFRKDRKPLYERAYARESRNKGWRAAADGGFEVQIVAHFREPDDAADFEMLRIAERGRENLVNLTDGGEGRRNGVFSESERQKRRENARGPRSSAWLAAIRASRKNGGNGGVVKRGDKLPPSWVASLAAAKLGVKNPYFGKPTAVSKKVINTATGEVYESISRAAQAVGMKPGKLYSILDGHTKVNTTALVMV